MCGRYRKLRYLKNDDLLKKPRCFEISVCLAIAGEKGKRADLERRMIEDAKNHK
jgi:hypothetical protein